MKDPTFFYILIHSEEKRHYGVFRDFGAARKELLEIEKMNGLPEGTIKIYVFTDEDIH